MLRGGGDSLEPAELLRPARGRVVSFRLKVHASWKLPCCHLLEMALVTLRCCQEDSHPQGRGVERPHPRNPAHRQHHGGVARGRWPWHGQGEHGQGLGQGARTHRLPPPGFAMGRKNKCTRDDSDDDDDDNSDDDMQSMSSAPLAPRGPHEETEKDWRPRGSATSSRTACRSRCVRSRPTC